MSSSPIRIGTRSSPLAMWQARWVQQLLHQKSIPTELVQIESQGDQDSTQPLYAMNIQGIFTKALDQALLREDIDIAVHSYKDVPTQLPQGIVLAAVLARGNTKDILVYKTPLATWPEKAIVGTSSLRRSAQWKHRYPSHQTATLRGNVQRRLQRLEESHWMGAMFAAAGLERVNQLPEQHLVLDWMIPAPAQGAVCVVARQDQPKLLNQLQFLDCQSTHTATEQERIFLRKLEGGCTAPVGAQVRPQPNGWYFTGGVFSVDGHKKSVFEQHFSHEQVHQMGHIAADHVLQNGGEAIMDAFKNK